MDEGPFFHGTKAELQVGDHLTAGDGAARVYVVEPTGEFENDPSVTDKKLALLGQ